MKRTLIASAALLAALALPIAPALAKSPEPECAYVWGGYMCHDAGAVSEATSYRFHDGRMTAWTRKGKLDRYLTRCTYLAERLFVDERLQTRTEILDDCMRREIIIGN